MPCGEEIDTTELYVTICWTTIRTPCGIKYCQTTVGYSYPCGIRWCRGRFGISYPCGILMCTGSSTYSYPCGLRWCDLNIPYIWVRRRPVKRYCYDFSSVGGACYFLYEDVYGCCDGQEYNWSAPCLFVTTSGSDAMPGKVDSSARYVRKCFDEPLDPIGPCRQGKSLPDVGDLPGSPVDAGSVSAHSPTGHRYSDDGLSNWGRKLGRCTRCMVASVVLAGLGWLLFLILPLDRFPFPALSTLVFGAFAIALTLPVVGHAIALLTRRSHNL